MGACAGKSKTNNTAPSIKTRLEIKNNAPGSPEHTEAERKKTDHRNKYEESSIKYENDANSSNGIKQTETTSASNKKNDIIANKEHGVVEKEMEADEHDEHRFVKDISASNLNTIETRKYEKVENVEETSTNIPVLNFESQAFINQSSNNKSIKPIVSQETKTQKKGKKKNIKDILANPDEDSDLSSARSNRSDPKTTKNDDGEFDQIEQSIKIKPKNQKRNSNLFNDKLTPNSKPSAVRQSTEDNENDFYEGGVRFINQE